MAAVMLDDASRATNIARALSLLDAAAGADPSPDLVALPAGCDRGGRVQGRPSPAMFETYRASLSAKAREWGVYVVAGQRLPNEDEPEHCATLLDPDGDEIAMCRSAGSVTPVTLCDSEIGVIGLTLDCPVGADAADNANPSSRPRIVVVVGGPVSEPTCRPDGFEAWCRLAAEWGSFACRIRPATKKDDADSVRCSDSSALESCVQCPSGQVVTAYLPDDP